MTPASPPDREVDVLVVGGGPAGLSAALVLGRSRRSVLVVDAGEPRNAPADAMHSFLTRDGTPSRELLALGRAEVARYGVQHHPGRATGASRVDGRFHVGLDGGGTVVARRLVVTTGLVDELPPVPGVAERWGRDVIHCPYCHGWEVRDRVIGVLVTSPLSLHQAGLDLLADLGLRAVEHPSGFGTHVPADAAGQTDVAGVWVAGNVTDPMAQVIAAAAQGNRAGAAVNADLVAEDMAFVRAGA